MSVARVYGQGVNEREFVEQIARRESAYFDAWRKGWRDTLDRFSRAAQFARQPAAVIHLRHVNCTPSATSSDLNTIRSAAKGMAVCPWWANPDTPPDAPSQPSTIRVELAVRLVGATLVHERQTIESLLDSAMRAFPSNDWVVGQRTRLLIEAGHLDSALHVAERCSASASWCASLRGYVHYKRGDLVQADSAFRLATVNTPEADKCKWTDIEVLLGDWPGEFIDASFKPIDKAPRTSYAKLSCAKRDSISSVAMWLADPLWSDDVNQRRVEHFARRMWLLLHSALPRDELYNWEPKYGGDALAELVLRFGLPDRVAWGGKETDDAVAADMRGRGQNVNPGTPYLTAEYRCDEYCSPAPAARGLGPLWATVPRWAVLTDPMSAGKRDLDPRFAANYPWSPEFMRGLRVAAISRDQSAMLRRDSNVVFAYAADLRETETVWRRGRVGANASFVPDSGAVILVRSESPDVFERFDPQKIPADGRIRLKHSIKATPAVVSIEVPSEKAAVRRRVPVTPPKTLSQMKAGEVAMSDLVMISGSDDGKSLTNERDAALARMLPTTEFSRGAKAIGVYWETYGFSAADTVDIAVRVQRITRQSLAERAAIALNMRGDKNAPVSIVWTEPQPGRASFTVRGPVTTIGRSLNLPIAALPAGDYSLEIAVANQAGMTASNRRIFSIE